MYIIVLGTSVMLTVIGLSALMLVRIERRSIEMGGDFTQARFHAQSAVELALWQVEKLPAWRTSFANGPWRVNQPIGTGTYAIEGRDPIDGDLSNNVTDPVELTAIGYQGDARYKLQVTLTPRIRGFSCLEAALHANRTLAFDGTTLQCDQVISSNDTVTASTSTINSDVEAVTAITGTTYNGTNTTPITPRAMPDTTVFDYYLANGTSMDLALIPKPATSYIVENVVISPTSNPYDALAINSSGIYIFNCLGADLIIRNSRIVGTLVILDPGPQTEIQQSVNWSPAVSHYPSLLVRGSIQVNLDAGGASLSEAVLATNFNPASTPYNDVTDSDTTDVYPSVISGLIYTSVDLDTAAGLFVEGVVVVGNAFNAAAGANIDLTYQPTYLETPPPGFALPPIMKIVEGSWRQVVD